MGLAVAVLADAFLLRMTVVPALMHLTGKWNWAIPSWLDRVLPHVSVASPGAVSPARPADEQLKLPVVSTVTDGPARIAERAELLEVLGSVPIGGDGETTARSGEEL